MSTLWRVSCQHDNGAARSLLIGGHGRDFLVGGFGADQLIGNADEDLLTGDSSSYESDPATDTLADSEALHKFLDDWNGHASRAERELALDDFVRSITDDLEKDSLNGSSGYNWFFAGIGDVIHDLNPNRRRGQR